MYNTILLVNSTLYFYFISLQREFFNHKTHWCQGRTQLYSIFFFRHNCNKSLWKNIFLVISHSCTSPLVCAPPQLPLLPSPTNCAVGDLQRLIFVNIQSPNKFTVKPKIVSHLTSSQESLKHKSTFTFTLRIIYPSTRSMAQLDISPDNENTHIRPYTNKGFRPATDKDAILAELLQHEEEKF